jgi:hypothetical protein
VFFDMQCPVSFFWDRNEVAPVGCLVVRRDLIGFKAKLTPPGAARAGKINIERTFFVIASHKEAPH